MVCQNVMYEYYEQILSTKWTIKKNPNGNYRARISAIGFLQKKMMCIIFVIKLISYSADTTVAVD
jgi:hypothetical protein